MELHVGVSGGRMDLNPKADELWRWFEGSVSVPFDYSAVKARAYPGPLDGIAASRLYIPEDPEFDGKEYARILVAEEFFSLTEEERFLTLLHESMHIASFLGALRPMLVKKGQLCRANPRPDSIAEKGAKAAGFLLCRYDLAFLLAEHLFEIDAELALKPVSYTHLRAHETDS